MELATDALIQDTLEGLCNAQTCAQTQGSESEKPEGTGPRPSSAQTEINAAAPRSVTARGSDDGAQADVDAVEKPSVWAQAGQRLAMQLLIVAFLLALMWWRGQLPHQRKAIEAVSLVFEDDRLQRGDEL